MSPTKPKSIQGYVSPSKSFGPCPLCVEAEAMPLQSQVDERSESAKEQPAASIQDQLYSIELQTRRHTEGFLTGLILCLVNKT
jgi:hypothetical protein